MILDDLLDMKVREVLDEFCVAFSLECDWFYGVARWEDVNKMFEEYDLEDEYCFAGEGLVNYGLEMSESDQVLEVEDLRRILDNLGIEKKQGEGGTNEN